MAVASFKGLCAGIYEIAGVIAPALEPDESGLIAFHVQRARPAVRAHAFRRHATPHAMLYLVKKGVMLALQWRRRRADGSGFPDVAQLMPSSFG